jgi:lipid-binding SYLF domain-containing protein
MKFTRLLKSARPNALFLFAVCAFALSANAAGDTRSDGQQYARSMAADTLQRLYAIKPAAKSKIEHAAGYAVFTNTGVKILVAGTGVGKGIAVNNKTKHETFMKMLELQAGLGLGIKKFSVIFVFDNDQVLNSFINSGWQLGAQANVSAKSSTKGGDLSGAIAVADGIWMYQMTDKGLSAEITAKGTKYYKDSDLN